MQSIESFFAKSGSCMVGLNTKSLADGFFARATVTKTCRVCSGSFRGLFEFCLGMSTIFKLIKASRRLIYTFLTLAVDGCAALLFYFPLYGEMVVNI